MVTPFDPGGESASGSPLEAVPLVGRMAGLIPRPDWKAGGHFLGLSGLLRLRSLLDQQSFGIRDSANAQREGKGVGEK